jgi:hypothetical protein
VALIGLAWTIVGAFALTLLLRKRAVTHDAVIMYVTQGGQDPYYFANCECGGNDGPEDDPELLFAAARKHTTNVRPEVETRSDWTSCRMCSSSSR